MKNTILYSLFYVITFGMFYTAAFNMGFLNAAGDTTFNERYSLYPNTQILSTRTSPHLPSHSAAQSPNSSSSSLYSGAQNFGGMVLISMAGALGVELVKICVIPGVQYLFSSSKTEDPTAFNQARIALLRAETARHDNETLKIYTEMLRERCKDDNSPDCQQLRAQLAKNKDLLVRNAVINLQKANS